MRILSHYTTKAAFLAILLTACGPQAAREQTSREQAMEDTQATDSDTAAKDCFDPSPYTASDSPDGVFNAYKTTGKISIDACMQEQDWAKANWQAMSFAWMGDPPAQEDYRGRFKVAWDQNYLYILVEVQDDTLTPTLASGVENYWKGDYVEVFIDEDRSGGDHKFNHQAFAYHVSTEGHAIDQSTQERAIFFDEHVEVTRAQQGDTYLWEMAIKLYDDTFDEEAKDNQPVVLQEGKEIGFSIAYGDNDGQNTRENFMGSKAAHGLNNDEGYINADVFGKLTLNP